MTPNPRPRARGRRGRRWLLGAVVLAPALLGAAAALAAHPAPASRTPAAVAAGPQARPDRVTLDALTTPAAPQGGGLCSIPGIGDVGGLVGGCTSGPSGILGIFSNCKNPPVPEEPQQAIAGWLQIRPARPPAPAPAFGPHPASTEYDQYGFAGLTWSMYDQSCVIPNVAKSFETSLGNWWLSAAKVTVAIDDTLHAWAADPSWMNTLTPILAGSAGTLYRDLFLAWAGVALLAVAITIMHRVHRSDAPGALTHAGWAALVIMLATAAAAAPAWAGEQAQGLMGSTVSLIDSGFAGPGSQASAAQAHDSLLVNDVLYPAWVRGEFGDPSSPTAREYGGQLLSDQALSWSEASAPPQQVSATVKQKQAAWRSTAAQVQQHDPEAYGVLTGNVMDRLGAGVMAAVTAFVACLFDIIASLVVITALVGVLAGTVMLPAVGVAGMHHGLRHLITGLGSRLLGMLLNAVLWAAAAAVDQAATRALLTQNTLPTLIALALLAILPVGLWLMIRVVRRRPAVPPMAKRAAMMVLGWKLLSRGAETGAARGTREAIDDASGTWTLRADPVYTVNGYPGGWSRRGSLNPVPPPPLDGPDDDDYPPQLPPGGPDGPDGGGPSGGPGGGGPSGGGAPHPGRRRPPWRPRRPADPGPGTYTGGADDDDAITPSGVFGPGEAYDAGDSDDSLYTGGA